MNTSIQGRNVDILQAKEKRVAFIRKLPFWSGHIVSRNLANFPIIDSLLTGNGKDMPVQVLEEVMNYLEVLSSNYEVYFSDINHFGTESSILIQKSISFDVSVLNDSNEAIMDDLIEFQEDPRKLAESKMAKKNLRV